MTRWFGNDGYLLSDDEVGKALDFWEKHRDDPPTPDAETLADVMTFLSTYEKDPPEVMKDDFAYDRLLDFIHEVARRALASRPAPRPVEPDRTAALEGALVRRDERLVALYRKGIPESAAVALVCDEALDRSGALLGRVRDAARLGPIAEGDPA